MLSGNVHPCRSCLDAASVATCFHLSSRPARFRKRGSSLSSDSSLSFLSLNLRNLPKPHPGSRWYSMVQLCARMCKECIINLDNASIKWGYGSKSQNFPLKYPFCEDTRSKFPIEWGRLALLHITVYYYSIL